MSASLRTVRQIADALPERPEHDAPVGEGLLFPLWPIGPGAETQPKGDDAPEPSTDAIGASPKRRGAKSEAPRIPSVGPTPKSARASIQQVLRWAEKQIVPRGITRPAGDGMPAGIELHDVEALGLGLLPGDRLITVDGVSVLERSQVVGAVLGARSRRAQAMTAGLVRRTKEGPVHFTVVVEQPYPEEVPDPG